MTHQELTVLYQVLKKMSFTTYPFSDPMRTENRPIAYFTCSTNKTIRIEYLPVWCKNAFSSLALRRTADIVFYFPTFRPLHVTLFKNFPDKHVNLLKLSWLYWILKTFSESLIDIPSILSKCTRSLSLSISYFVCFSSHYKYRLIIFVDEMIMDISWMCSLDLD